MCYEGSSPLGHGLRCGGRAGVYKHNYTPPQSHCHCPPVRMLHVTHGPWAQKHRGWRQQRLRLRLAGFTVSFLLPKFGRDPGALQPSRRPRARTCRALQRARTSCGLRGSAAGVPGPRPGPQESAKRHTHTGHLRENRLTVHGTTLRGDEAGVADSTPATTWILKLLAELHTVEACHKMSLSSSNVLSDHYIVLQVGTPVPAS